MIKRLFIRMLVLTAGVLGVGVADAADMDGVLKAGFDFGGESLAGDVLFVDGYTESLRANEGLFVGGGVAVFNEAKTVNVEITLNWKYTAITAENGDIQFTRFPLDALLFYNFPKVRIGAGATYHLNPELDSSGLGGIYARDTSFDDALGFIGQVDWRVAEKVALGLRYTMLDYDVANGGGTVESDGVGLAFTAMF